MGFGPIHHVALRCLRRLRCALPAILVCSSMAAGQNTETVVAFDRGVKLFTEETYAEALEAFQTAEASGEISSALYYNIGNTYFRLNQLGRAILYYERALRLEPGNQRIQHSLAIARERTEDRFSEIPDPIWVIGWKSVVRLLKPRGLFALGLLFYLFGLGLVAHRIYSGTPNDWRRRGIVAGLTIGTALLGAGLYASHESTLVHEAVVVHTSTEVFETPDSTGDAIIIVHEGLVVTQTGSAENWKGVRLPNGVTGWIRDDALEEI